MSDLRELYQEVIAEHNKSPRNFRKVEGANRKAEGFNPLCGDRLTVYMRVNDQDLIEDVSFEGTGCAISVASASLMTQMLKGKAVAEAERLFTTFHEVVTQDGGEPDLENLGKLAVLAGVREFPSRVKCATLSWHTMHAAVAGEGQVTTE